MRHLLVVILFCAIPFTPSYANQQIIDAIKAIEIEGISVSTSVEEARSALIEKGYEEGLSSPRSTRFMKGVCYVEIGHMMSTSLLKYRCDGSSPSTDATVIRALEDLCAIDSNGGGVRAGCSPPDSRVNANRIEQFQVLVGGNKYSVKIWDMENPSGPRIRHIDIVTLIRK